MAAFSFVFAALTDAVSGCNPGGASEEGQLENVPDDNVSRRWRPAWYCLRNR
jgi:hypothetical protein